MAVTAKDLETAESRFRFEMEMVQAARLERNRLVSAAVADGWTHARVASATALSRARVGQIALNGN